jgi:P-type E1-E2 ATPase
LVGDIVKIKAGMNIPVDGIIVKSSGVVVNESAMTGESDELKKENLDICKQRQEEKETELQFSKIQERKHNDIPSPIMLSGT